MTPADVLAAILNEALVPLFVSFVLGAVTWITWVSNKMREVVQSLATIEKTIQQIPVLMQALEDHRREDAATFAHHEARIESLERAAA